MAYPYFEKLSVFIEVKPGSLFNLFIATNSCYCFRVVLWFYFDDIKTVSHTNLQTYTKDGNNMIFPYVPGKFDLLGSRMLSFFSVSLIIQNLVVLLSG